MNHRSTLGRRDFLKLFLAGSTVLAAHAFSLQTVFADGLMPVPCSLMLHSRHHRVLPQILDYVREQGYEGITYAEFEAALMGRFTLPARPFLLSIDDLAMARGLPSFDHFARMKETLVNYSFKATFGVITRPDVPQDDALWAEVARWPSQGMALECHTAYHSNLDNPNFETEDYAAEIIEPTRQMQERLGCVVRALITPYGSGYNYQTNLLNPQVVDAARGAGLRFIVGISAGRTPISVPVRRSSLIYLGRIQPYGEGQDAAYDALWQIGRW